MEGEESFSGIFSLCVFIRSHTTWLLESTVEDQHWCDANLRRGENGASTSKCNLDNCSCSKFALEGEESFAALFLSLSLFFRSHDIWLLESTAGTNMGAMSTCVEGKACAVFVQNRTRKMCFDEA
jgi:hypothetical protein